MKLFKILFPNTFWSFLSLVLMGVILGTVAYALLAATLPDVETLKEVQLQVPLRIYTADGQLISEFGEKRRRPVRLEDVPPALIQAILATEDRRFYDHPGVDFIGLTRAAVEVVSTGTKSQGGSTITMQVARNFFLTRQKTFARKIKEILLAIKIDREISKDKILELYLNKIYFGQRAYGVAAAAWTYYGKPLDQLTLPEIAMIAGLPKAPSRNNPISNPSAALERRNHVLERMFEEETIDQATLEAAQFAPITASRHKPQHHVNAPYVAEMVRQAMVSRFGESAYTQGFQVYTTIDSTLQEAAIPAIRKGLLAYDQRHGYRGPLKQIALNDAVALDAVLETLQPIQLPPPLDTAIVTSLTEDSANAVLKNGNEITIAWDNMSWARKRIDENTLGPRPKTSNDILQVGDVIAVQPDNDAYRLAQVPVVEGAMIAMNPQNGAITSLVGGYSFNKSKYNRVTQAERQPGSAFKPFVYAAALAKGMSLATIINDAPVVLDDSGKESLWRPQNHTRRFYGPTRLRVGLTKSRNLVSIRILENTGIPYAIDFIHQMGFDHQALPNSPSLALGSGTTTPLELNSGFAIFANGGYRVTPFLIEHITNTAAKVIYQAPVAPTDEEKESTRVMTPQVAYLMNVALKDVVEHGTGRRAKVLKRHDLAGKTGTTNDQLDAWFSGFNSDVVTTVWVGFDKPRSLNEYGAQAALPIWIDFMKAALKGKPENSLKQPTGITTARIDPQTGLVAPADQSNAIFEIFRSENLPKQTAPLQAENVYLENSDDEEEAVGGQLF